MNMENFDDVIFEDDEFGDIDLGQQKPEGNEGDQPAGQQKPSAQPDEDLTTEVLRLKGITDPGKIKFEDETGAIVERAWDSLSREEQINILIDQEVEQQDFDDSELQLINTIRESGMTPDEYIQSLLPETDQLNDIKSTIFLTTKFMHWIYYIKSGRIFLMRKLIKHLNQLNKMKVYSRKQQKDSAKST